MTVFVGEIDNNHFVAAHAIQERQQNRLTAAMIDVAPQGPCKIPLFNAAGWAIHAANSELSPEELAGRLEAMVPGEDVRIVDTDPETLRADMERYLGHDMVEGAFRLPGRLPEAEPAETLHAY